MSYTMLTQPIIKPFLRPFYADTLTSFSGAVRQVARKIQPITIQRPPQPIQITATTTGEVAKTFFQRLPQLFSSALSSVKTLIKTLPKNAPSLFPVFYAYLLYHYKAIHLQNINICILATSQPKTLTITLGKGNQEHRFTLKVQAGRKYKLLRTELKNTSTASRIHWTSSLPNPFSLLTQKRHEFQTIYTIHIQDHSTRKPLIASFSLPDTKTERLRIVQSKLTKQIPIYTNENVKKTEKVYNSQRRISIPSNASNLHVTIPSQSKDKTPEDYIQVVRI